MEKMKNWCKLPYETLKDERLTLADAAVYAVLLDISNKGIVSRTIAEIAKIIGLSESQTKRYLKKLEDSEYILSKKTDGRRTIIELKQIISPAPIPADNGQEQKPKKKRKPESEQEENQEHVEEALRNVLAKKMNGKSEKAVAEKYEELKAQASARVTDKSKILAYLSKMISNYQDKPDNSDGFDADDYECFLNNF